MYALFTLSWMCSCWFMYCWPIYWKSFSTYVIVLLSAHIISIYFYTCNAAQSCTKENPNALSCLFVYLRRKYLFVCLSSFFLSAHYSPHSPSSPQSLFARRRNAVAEVCFGRKHPSGNTRIILSCHASFPSYTGMNMHWHLVIENALSPWAHDLINFTRVSCHHCTMLPPLSVCCTWSSRSRSMQLNMQHTQIPPTLPARVMFFFPSFCHLKVTKQGTEMNSPLSFVCQSPWRLSFQTYIMQQSPHKAPAELCTSVDDCCLKHNFLWGMRKAKVAV